MILDYLSQVKAELYKPRPFYEPTARPVSTSVDWLRTTNTNITKFNKFIDQYMPLLRGYGMEFLDTGKGGHGYTNHWYILFNEQVVGGIYADALNEMGGMFELTGKGCQLLQIRWDLWCYLMAGLKDYDFGITRLDIAADFKGDVWEDYGNNIIDVADMAYNGMFKVGRGKLPSTDTNGDWLEIHGKKLTSQTYEPKKHCLSGLTINVGAPGSVNNWCVYEKGKQLAGKNPELYDDSMFSWLRIERRFARGSGRSKVVIPFEFTILPDEAFVYNCDGVSSFVSDWLSFQKSAGVDVSSVPVSDIKLEPVAFLGRVALERTARHVASQSGRFFRSLVELDIDPMEFVNAVIKDKPNRGFSLDLCSHFDLNKTFGLEVV